MLKNELISLNVAGTRYTGWETSSITKSIDSCSGKFTFTLETYSDLEAASLVPGAPCEVYIGDDQLIGGYIDKVLPSGDSDGGISFNIEGRDKTEDLIDCSADQAPYTWHNITLVSLAKKICEIYGVSVSYSGKFEDPKTTFALEVGESPFELLSKGAKARNVLLIPNGQGNIFIGRPGEAVSDDSLVLGKNITRWNAEYDGTNRFYKYTIKGQRSNSGGTWGKANVAVHGTAYDEEIRPCRAKILTADNAETNITAKARAQWEAISRAAQASSISVDVPSFRQSTGKLWKVNQRVQTVIDAKAFSIRDEFLISAITYSCDDNGTVSKLTLKRKDAYTEFLRAKVKRGKKKSGIVWK